MCNVSKHRCVSLQIAENQVRGTTGSGRAARTWQRVPAAVSKRLGGRGRASRLSGRCAPSASVARRFVTVAPAHVPAESDDDTTQPFLAYQSSAPGRELREMAPRKTPAGGVRPAHVPQCPAAACVASCTAACKCRAVVITARFSPRRTRARSRTVGARRPVRTAC